MPFVLRAMQKILENGKDLRGGDIGAEIKRFYDVEEGAASVDVFNIDKLIMPDEYLFEKSYEF